MKALVPSFLGFVVITAGLVLFVGASTSGCGSDTENSDAGPVDAGEVDCEEACDDLLDINHIVEHVTDLGQ